MLCYVWNDVDADVVKESQTRKHEWMERTDRSQPRSDAGARGEYCQYKAQTTDVEPNKTQRHSKRGGVKARKTSCNADAMML
jgi:hypothetical protein